MDARLSSPSLLERTVQRLKSGTARTALVALLGISQSNCGIVEVNGDTAFIQVPVSLGRDVSTPSEAGTPDAATPTDGATADMVDASMPPVDTGNDVVMGTDVTDARVDGGMGTDVADAGTPPVDVPVDTPVDAGMPCRPVSITVSSDNINNSYDTQSAVPVVINTTGDCSMVGPSLPFSLNYGASVSVIRPILAIDPVRSQIRSNLDLTDPALVGFPDNHRGIRIETTINGVSANTNFLRKRYGATFVSGGTMFGTFGGTTEYNGRVQLNDTSTPARPDDFNRDALIGIDITNDSGTSLLWHGSLTTCSFGSTTNTCTEEVGDGSGRTQRCFIPNMLTSDRSSGFCDVSEGRVFTYPGNSVSYLMQIRGTDFTRIRTATPIGGYIRAAIYVTDIAQNVTIGNYRFRRGD